MDMPTDMQKKTHLNFQGYWREAHRHAMPHTPGVFCVYRCAFEPGRNGVRPSELLEIGEVVSPRMIPATDLQRWRAALAPGEELCFTFAPLILGRKRAAAELARAHRPRLARGSPTVPLILSGRMALLRA